MAIQYSDQLFMMIGNDPYELAEMSYEVSQDTKTAVKSMNPKNRPLGTSTSQGEATFQVKVPHRAGLPDWSSIENQTITFVQRVGASPNFTAVDSFYVDHKGSATVDGQQAVDVSLGCLDWREGL